MPPKSLKRPARSTKLSTMSRSTNTTVSASASTPRRADKVKSSKDKPELPYPKAIHDYVPINTGMDSVAEVDRSVTDTLTVQTADGDGVVRVKVRSKQLMEVFRPIRLFLHIFARFPYSSHIRLDGTICFTYKTCFQTFNAFLFTVGSVISVALFLVVLAEFVCVFIGVGKSEEVEVCKMTWEERKMTQAMVPLTIFFCWSASFAISSIYSIRYGKRYEFFYNYWNRAVQVMDMDATYGLRQSAIVGHVMFGLTVVAYSVLFFSFEVELLQTTAAMIINAFTRYFVHDIYKGNKKAFRLKEYLYRYENRIQTLPPVFEEQMVYIILKTVGFAIMMYSMYGARCFIIQFSFFCRALRNASFIWNERYRNHLMKEKTNMEDQTRVRMDMTLLNQDHLILVQLFKMTESIFCVALQWFYAFQFITITMALYGFSLITGVMRCSMYWTLVEAHNCNETNLRKYDWLHNDELVSFEPPFSNHSVRKLGDSLTYILMFAQSFTILFYTTHAGAAAHEEAMRGWQILRRNSFMTAQDVYDRNFVHSLVISFARNNPLQISAGGYFVVDKRLLLNMLVAVMVYFITLLQFQPGQINMNAACNGKILETADFADDL